MKVVQFPQQAKVNDIAAMARKFADALEAGEYGEGRSVLLILDGESLDLFNWGEGLTHHESVGMLEMAKAVVINRVIGE